MENQTRYDLNAAIENWLAELAAQPNLTSDDRRELETHLRDAIAGFQQRGLNDEESFWLACKRVGQPPELGEEFVKSDPTNDWRERVFWMANALLFVNLWSSLIGAFSLKYARGNLSHPWQLKYYLFISMSYCVLILCCVVFLASSRLRHRTKVLSFIFQSRARFILVGLLLVLAVNFLRASATVGGALVTQVFFLGLIIYSPWSLSLIGLIAWLMPVQNRKTPRRS
jgi:hypothetical protein